MCIAIGGMIAAALGSFSIFIARNFSGIANYSDLDSASRNALDTLSTDIRQSESVVSCTKTKLVLQEAGGASITYLFRSGEGTLTRTKAGTTQTLLRDCESLTFNLFQRNPVAGTYDQYPTADASTAKLVSMSWVCARRILGQIRNSESIQTAKVVIRKQ